MKRLNGIFDNTATLRRECYKFGRLICFINLAELSIIDFEKSELSVSWKRKWGHFPDLPRRKK